MVRNLRTTSRSSGYSIWMRREERPLIRCITVDSARCGGIDRGMLAAAALTQVVDAEITVREFLENRTLSENDLNVLVSSDAALNYRRIDAGAGAEYEMNTIFLRMVGLGKLKVAARSAAIQGARDVEVSLVLDISGSMARENTGGTSLKRLDVLRDTASGFVDAILTPTAIPTTSLSLVPFSGQVNAGPLFDMLNGTRIHNYSSCTEFADSDSTRQCCRRRTLVPRCRISSGSLLRAVPGAITRPSGDGARAMVRRSCRCRMTRIH
jgi:hypothetical protein